MQKGIYYLQDNKIYLFYRSEIIIYLLDIIYLYFYGEGLFSLLSVSLIYRELYNSLVKDKENIHIELNHSQSLLDRLTMSIPLEGHCGKQNNAPTPYLRCLCLNFQNLCIRYVMWKRGIKVADKIMFANQMTLR